MRIKRACIIAPSILSSDFTRLGEQIQECEAAGADWIHVDVMDGHFVPNLTMGPVIVEACRRVTRLPIDVHLMVQSPERLLDSFARAGANNLTVHVEACPDIRSTLKTIRSLGCNAGITLNPDTPTSTLEPGLDLSDLVLVMTVNPGYAGQEFIESVLPKVAEIRERLDALDSPAWLEVDGGITAETLPRVRDAGADAFVAASAVFQHPDGITEAIRKLRSRLT
ncbi:MAG: ribulose-phosphate 3-epimerase [Chloroflexota bacterium]